MTQGWDDSAAAWIAHIGDDGDRGRKDILDRPMLEAVRASGAKTALDVGCGEGRFCRMMQAEGLETTGLEPTTGLRAAAQERDTQGRYVDGRAEALPFDTDQFDLVVSYLSLIDIEDYRTGIAEMARVLGPGGTLLVGNLASHITAFPRDWPEDEGGWIRNEDGSLLYHAMDDYMRARANWVSWNGIRIVNHHRPLSAYMDAFLSTGLLLRRYDEPPYYGENPALADRFQRCPWFNLMVWEKPA